jgi:hypothetical protein
VHGLAYMPNRNGRREEGKRKKERAWHDKTVPASNSNLTISKCPAEAAAIKAVSWSQSRLFTSTLFFK